MYISEHWRRVFFKTGFFQTFVKVQKNAKSFFPILVSFVVCSHPVLGTLVAIDPSMNTLNCWQTLSLKEFSQGGLYVNTIKQGGLYVNTSRRCWNGVMTLFRMALTCVLFLVNLFSAKLLKCTGWLLFKVALQPQRVMHKLSFCGSGGGKCSAFCLPCCPCRAFSLHLFCT